MPHVTELGLLARTLTEQPRVRVGRGNVCFIGSFLAVEVAPGIAAAALRRLVGSVLWHEALHAGPSLDQRAVNREVLARQELAHLRQMENPGHELGRDIAAQEPVAVLAEHGCVPYRIVRRKTHKPAEQKIIVELLHKQPFGAHAVEGLKKQSAQKPLGRDARPAVPRVEPGERPRQSRERLINKRADRTERMIRRKPPFEVHVTEQLCWLLVNSAHRTPSDSPIRLANHRQTESHSNRRANRLFQQPASLAIAVLNINFSSFKTIDSGPEHVGRLENHNPALSNRNFNARLWISPNPLGFGPDGK